MQIVPTNVSAAECKIIQYAVNKLHNSHKTECDQAALDKMEVTGMRSFQGVSKFTVRDEGFVNKITNDLIGMDCPEQIIHMIVKEIEHVEEDMKVKSDCKVEGGTGSLYKIAYSLSRENGRATVAMMVFGASFDVQQLERWETTKTPITEDVVVEKTVGWLWLKAKTTTVEKRITGYEEKKTPVLKGMSHRELDAGLNLLENKACERLLETTTPNPISDAHPAVPLALPETNKTGYFTVTNLVAVSLALAACGTLIYVIKGGKGLVHIKCSLFSP
eukprot:GEMP01037019.1.p1 GENE.GEMP01037019.1~~GEMP01037019.1.p1  ORF type:complete len:275 (+),score=58.99 GEMP01037019.1:32-856(+)